MPSFFRRRGLLRIGGVAACSPLAGCASIQAEQGLRTQRLGRVVLANSIDESIDVDVQIHRDETLVHESSHRLASGSSEERVQVVLNEWTENNAAQSWEIKAKTGTSEWRRAEVDAAAGGRDDCHDVKIVAGDWPETPLLVLLGDCTEKQIGTQIER